MRLALLVVPLGLTVAISLSSCSKPDGRLAQRAHQLLDEGKDATQATAHHESQRQDFLSKHHQHKQYIFLLLFLRSKLYLA